MKQYLQQLVLAVSICLALPQPSEAQSGNDNPTGVAGEYNGDITTGGSIDPYTGNARRFVDDLTVTGSVGKYPLTWTRILNTRGTFGAAPFGQGGSWGHSYAWGLWVRPDLPPVPPNPYEGPGGQVFYPDGRIMDLRLEADYVYLQANGIETLDRLQHVGGGNYDLLTKDGGRVEFRHPSGSTSGDDLIATAIVDPNGQSTTLEYLAGRLHTITEPGQRYLEISYKPIFYMFPHSPPNQVLRHFDVIDKVKAFDGRGTLIETVTYSYQEIDVLHFHFAYLTGAAYDDGNTATYTYEPSNVAGNYLYDPHQIRFGMVHTCHDFRYAGPMSDIEYEYTTRSENLVEVAWGQVKKEKYPGGLVVTEVVFPHITYPPNLQAFFQRTEKRPDGSIRSFQYSMGGEGELQSYTDLALPGAPHHTSTISYTPAPGSDNYIKILTDARLNQTMTEKEPIAGANVSVSHPGCTPATYVYSDAQKPYHLITKTDERGNPTHYDRDDPNNPYRISKIRYPDGGFETFTYDQNLFGLVHEHRMTSGGTETFEYDNRGLKTSYTPPFTWSDPDQHKTLYFYYGGPSGPGEAPGAPARPDLMDRLHRVIDPRGNSTWYEYNGRGQVTRVTHQDTTFTQSYYNADGTLQWSEDELQHRTTYTYDEYKRVRTVENAVHHTVTNDYTPPGGLSPLSHTTSSVYHVTSHMGKVIEYDYDANFRRKRMTVAPTTADWATTTYTYDPVGNLETVTDPNGQPGQLHAGAHTTYEYDERNRRKTLIDALGHPTAWLYDAVGNMTRETRADNKFRTWDLYDAMNRIKHTTGFLGAQDQTSYGYDPAGNLTMMTDANGGIYSTVYDELNRKQSASYPPDAAGNSNRTEIWRYDAAGNLRAYQSPAEQMKHFEFDVRNRQTVSYWNYYINDFTPNLSAGPKIETTPDAASRIGIIITNDGATSVIYGYDDANHKLWEKQQVTGWPARRVDTTPDDDGNRATLSVDGVLDGYSFTYQYTPRQQLWHISRNGSPYFEYNYDKNANLTKRQHMIGGQGRDSTTFFHDEINRVTLCDQKIDNSESFFARSNYNDYDHINNLKSISRHEDGDTGELFTYDDANQLSSVSYKADVVPHAPGGAPGGMVEEVEKDTERDGLAALEADPVREPLALMMVQPDAPAGPRTVTYLNDAINRQAMTDSGAVTSYAVNHLNQYTAVTSHGSATYDASFNLFGYDGWTYLYDPEKRLTSATTTTGGGHSALFVYDGLGRCVKRTIDGVTTAITFDEWKPIVEWGWSNGASQAVAWNLYGPGADEILVRNQPSTAGYLYYHLDATGNVQFLLSGDILGLEKYTYDAFGKPTITGWNGEPRPISAYGNRFLFTGREYLYTLGLYDYRHRIYHPGLGHFIQTDPTGLQIEGAKLSAHQTALYPVGSAPAKFGSSELNLYRYCHNAPVNKSDPSGLYVVYSGKWSEADAENFKKAFAEQWNTKEGRAQWEARYNSDLASIVSPHRDALIAPNGGAVNFAVRDTTHPSGDGPLTPFGQTARPQQDRKLTDGEIKALQKGDVDPHELKPKDGGSRFDLFKDPEGNISVKLKDGSGPGDPTGLNINDFSQHLP